MNSECLLSLVLLALYGFGGFCLGGVCLFWFWWFSWRGRGCVLLLAEEAQSPLEAPDEPYSLMDWKFLPEEWEVYMLAEFPQGITTQEYIVKYS